jgi:hypothetical protein
VNVAEVLTIADLAFGITFEDGAVQRFDQEIARLQQQAKLQVRVDIQADAARAVQETQAALRSVEAATKESADRAGLSWREFNKLASRELHQQGLAHAELHKEVGRLWQEYKRTGQTALEGVSAAAKTAATDITRSMQEAKPEVVASQSIAAIKRQQADYVTWWKQALADQGKADKAYWSAVTEDARRAASAEKQAVQSVANEVATIRAKFQTGVGKHTEQELNSLRNALQAVTAKGRELEQALLLRGAQTGDANLRSLANSARLAQATMTAAEGSASRLGLATQVTTGITNAFRGAVTSLTAALAVGGAVQFGRAMDDMTAQAARADNMMLIFERTIASNNLDMREAEGLVGRLADRFKVVPSVVQDATVQLVRNGASLKQVETLLEGAGASALAFGKTARSGFENVAGALASGSSAMLNQIGIAENLGPALDKYARSMGKTADALTKQEQAQVLANLVMKATTEEVGSLDVLLAGYTGTVGDLERAKTRLAQTVGRALTPVMTAIVKVLADGADAAGSFIEAFDKYAPILAGVTAGIVTLAAAIYGPAALSAALAAIPALAARAGASIAVAFGPAGVAALAVSALAVAVTSIFADIKEAERQMADAEANRQKMRRESESYRVSDDLVNARMAVGNLERELQDDIERLRNARKLNAPTIDILREVQDKTAQLDAARKQLLTAQDAYDAVRAKNAQKQAPAKSQAADEKAGIEQQIRDLIRLEQQGNLTGKALEENLNKQDQLREKYKGLGGDVTDLTRRLSNYEAGLRATTREAKENETAHTRTENKAESLETSLRKLSNAFRDQVKDGKVSQSELDSFTRQYEELKLAAEAAGVTLPKAALATADALLKQGQAATGNAAAMAEAERRAKALADYQDGRKLQAWAVGLVNATDKQLEQARAVAIQTQNTERLRIIDEEMDRRRERRLQIMNDLTHAYLRQAQAVSDKRYGDGVEATLSAVQRSYGAFTSVEDAMEKLGRAGISLTIPMLTSLKVRFGEAGDAADNFGEDVAGAAREVQEAQKSLGQRFADGLEATISAVQRTEGPFKNFEDAQAKMHRAGVTLTAPMLDALAARFPTVAQLAEEAAQQVADFGTAADTARPQVDPFIDEISRLANVDSSNPEEFFDALDKLDELSLTGPTEYIRELASTAAEGLRAARDAAVDFVDAMNDVAALTATSSLTNPNTGLVTEVLGYQNMDPSGPDAVSALARLADISGDEGVSQGIRDLATLIHDTLKVAVEDAIERGLVEATPATTSLTDPLTGPVQRILDLAGTRGKDLDDLNRDLAELQDLATNAPTEGERNLADALTGGLQEAITQAEALRDAVFGIKDASSAAAPAVAEDLNALFTELGQLQATDVLDPSAYATAMDRLGEIAARNIPVVSDMAKTAAEDLTLARDAALELADAITDAPRTANLTNPTTTFNDLLAPYFAEVGTQFAGAISGALSDPESYDAKGIGDALIGVSDEALQDLYAHFAASGTAVGDFFANLIDIEAGKRATARENDEPILGPDGLPQVTPRTLTRPDRTPPPSGKRSYGRNALGGTDLDALREGMDLGIVSAGDYRAALEDVIGSLESLPNPTQATKNKIAELKAELKGLDDPTRKILGGLGDLSDVLKAFDDPTMNGLATVIDTGLAAFEKFSKGDIAGGIATIAVTLINAFQAAQREAEEFKKSLADLDKQLIFTSRNAVSNIRTERGGFLGFGTKQVLEVDEFALNVAETIEGAIVDGISNGFMEAIDKGDFSLFAENFQKSIGTAVLEGLIDAFVRGEIIKNILQPAIDSYVEARKTPGLEDDRVAINAIREAAGLATREAETFYNDVLVPVGKDFGLYGAGAEKTEDVTKNPFGSVNLPSIGIQSAIATPILEAARSFDVSTQVQMTASNNQLAAGNLQVTAANIQAANAARFDAVITRLEQAAANGTAGLRYA